MKHNNSELSRRLGCARNYFDDFSGTNALRTHTHTLVTYATFTESDFDAHTLQIGKPSPLRMIAGFTYPVASHRFFAAHMTDTSHVVHLLSPIPSYYPNCALRIS